MAASSKKALLGAVAANLGIATVKFVVGALTQSTVMIAEAIHSLVDTGNSGLMLFGEWRSRHPPDDEHPFGYGMELYFWSFVVAMVVFGGGGGLSIYEGTRALFHPRVVTSLWPNYLVIVVGAVFEGVSLAIGLREFAVYRREKHFSGSILAVMRASKNPAIFVTVLEDSAALVGLALAASGLTLSHVLGMPVFDAVASILIGVVLVAEAALLGFECRGLIIGEAARPLVVTEMRRALAEHPEIGRVVGLRSLQLGPESVMLVLAIRAEDTRTTGDVARANESLAARIRALVPSVKHIVFEFAAGPPPSDPVCRRNWHRLGREVPHAQGQGHHDEEGLHGGVRCVGRGGGVGADAPPDRCGAREEPGGSAGGSVDSGGSGGSRPKGVVEKGGDRR
jgi:cation diffusion facilitator family transporter